MKLFTSLLLVLSISIAVFSQSPKDSKTAAVRAEKSSEILKQFAALGVDSLPIAYLKKAKAVAVFPGLTRVNILLSELTIGNGIIAARDENGEWGKPVFVALKGQDFNLKIAGKKSFDAVLLIMEDDTLKRMIRGDIGFASSDKRQIALGPVIGGKGADDLMQNAKVIYYAFDQGQIIDPGLSTDSFFKTVGVLHDNNLNKSVYRMRTKQLFRAPEASVKVPEGVEIYRTVLTEIAPKILAQPDAGQTIQNQQ